MMNILRLCISLCVAILVFSCNEDQPKVAVRNIAIPIKQDVFRLSEVADSLSYVPLESNSECMIGQIDKIILTDDNIIVLDRDQSRSVFIFDNQGLFLAKINKYGQGPGEYLSLVDISFDDKTKQIYIADCTGRKILSYTINGEFLRDFRFDHVVDAIECVGDDKIVAYCRFSANAELNKNGSYPNILIFDTQSLEVRGELYFSDKIESSSIVGMISSLSGTNDNGCNALIPLNDTIYTFTNRGLAPKYYLNFGDKHQTQLSRYIKESEQDVSNAMQADSKYKESEMAHVLNFIVAQDFIYLFYKVDNRLYYGLYYPSSGKFIESCSSEGIPIYNDIDNTIPFMPIASHHNKLVYILEPYLLEGYNGGNSEINNIVRESNIDSNPIVVFAHMKYY